MVTAIALSGNLTFNPIHDSLINEDGEEVKLDPPTGFANVFFSLGTHNCLTMSSHDDKIEQAYLLKLAKIQT